MRRFGSSFLSGARAGYWPPSTSRQDAACPSPGRLHTWIVGVPDPGKTESGLAYWPARVGAEPTRATSASARSNVRFLGGSRDAYEVYSAVPC